VDATFAPHAMRKLDGTIEGFNVDMAMEIGKRLKRPVNIEGTQFSGLIPGLNAKKYDWIAAPTTVTPQRAEQMLFTEGYLDTDFQFLVKKSDAEINSLDDLKGKTISVNKGSAYETWAKENMGKAGRTVLSNAVKCMKMDGTYARLHEKWFGSKPAADSAAVKVSPGHGVVGMPGYDPTPNTPQCS